MTGPVSSRVRMEMSELDKPQSGVEAAVTGPLRIRSDHESSVRLSLVLPTYNEAKNIGEIVRRLTVLLDSALSDAYELIVVDDDSPDRTWEVALQLMEAHPKLRVIRRTDERGLSSAVIRGWQAARGDVLAVIDADLQHPPEVTLKLWERMGHGADLAVASRHVEGGGVSDWNFARRVLSRGAQLLGLVLLPGIVGRVSDPMSGFFMVRRRAIQGPNLHPMGYKILLEVLGRGSVGRIAEVPYVFRERTEGESKVTSRLYVEYLGHLLRLRVVSLPLDRFWRFAVVGMSGVVIDMGLLYFLSDPHALGWPLTRSKIAGAEAAIINNFVWNDVWTFNDVATPQARVAAKLVRFLKFQLICLSGLVINVTLLNVQFNVLHINRYVANAIAIAVVTVWNFWLNLKLGWRVTAMPSPRNEQP